MSVSFLISLNFPPDSPHVQKQSDTQSHNHLRRDSGLRKLCVMGGLKYVFDGSGAYTDWTDWKEQD